MPGISVDKQVLARRVSRSAATYDRSAIVQAEMAEQLVADLLEAAGMDRFERVLELGCGTGLLTRQLMDRCGVGRLVLNDLVRGFERTAESVRADWPDLDVEFLAGDMERVQLPGDQDLIMSNAVFQWTENPRELLARLVGLLRGGGVLAMSAFGPGNLQEMAESSGVSLRYRTLDQWRNKLEQSCEVLKAHECRRVLWFASSGDALRHLRETGVNALGSANWPQRRIRQFCADYEKTHGREGRVPVTYHPLFLVARKRKGA